VTRGPRIFIRTDDEPPKPPSTDCPNNAAHEPWPTGYLSSHAYAEQMMQAHNQSQCPACERWVIWTPKEGQS
jgi:hypothetical protein